MKYILSSLTALLTFTTMGDPLVAATPAPTTAKPVKPVVTPLALAPGIKRGTLSPEGRTIAARIYGAPDPHITELQSQIAALKAERAALIASPPIDLDKLEPMLRQEELLSTELRARLNDRLMLLLRQLPEADRAIALQNMANPARPQSSVPAVKPVN